MAYPAEKKTKYTYEDYLRIPEDKRYELIGGELIVVPSPKTKHQRISAELGFLLMSYVKENNAGVIFYAPYDVYFDEENVVQPDILFVSKERQDVITEDNVKGAPDLVVEIVSPSSGYYDLVKKKKLYARFGVKEYWLVDPEEKTVEIYLLEKDTGSFEPAQSLSEKDQLTSKTFPGLSIDLNKLFE
ncbi:MAG: Uma2 family endonuclease [Actinobacteria bacterium]|nr:Uma2 family endonuclease [Actinomycetota bacterium]